MGQPVGQNLHTGGSHLPERDDVPVIKKYLHAMSYRRPMIVHSLVIFVGTPCRDSYYRCPRCHRTLEREFMQYCDRCGQRLDWSQWELAEVEYKK